MSDVYHGKRSLPFPKEHTQILDNKYVKNKTAFIASSIFHVSPTTVAKYSNFATAVDEIRRKNKTVGDAILTQSFRISMENTMLLAKLSPARIAQAYREGISKLPDNFTMNNLLFHKRQIRKSNRCRYMTGMPNFPVSH